MTSSEFRQALSDYQTLTAKSRAADNSDAGILAQLKEVLSRLQTADSEGYEGASSAASDVNSYISLIQSKLDTNAAAATAAAKKTADDVAANKTNVAENKKTEDATTSATTASTAGQASGVTPKATTPASTAKQSTTAGADYTGPQIPGVRMINPLSQFSSYTYSLVLYMMTPEAFTNFTLAGGSMSGIKGKGKGVYIVAQSGGINGDIEDRAITFSGKLGDGEAGLDYFIDDLTIVNIMPAGGGDGATASTEFKFKIIQPTGFSFVQDIGKTSRAINLESKITTNTTINPLDQFYVLGIKFYGYDVNGTVMSATSPEVAGYDNGGSDGDKNAVIQRYFGIKINGMKFKLDNKVTHYDMTAVPASDTFAYGTINSTIKKDFTIAAGTVAEALGAVTGAGIRGLSEVLNNEGKDQKDRGVIDTPTKYTFEFYDEDGKKVSPTESVIGKSGLVDKTIATADNAPVSTATDLSKVTIADSYKAGSIPKGKKSISVPAGTSLVSVVDNIIVKSNFISDALTKTISQDAEAQSVKKSPTATLQWYSLSPYAVPRARENGNWVCDLTYQIRPFSVPYLRSDIVGATSKYTGPYKFYHYYFTGQNSEVLEYSQQFDNLFFMLADMPTNPDADPVDKPKDNTPRAVSNAVEGSNNSGNNNKAGQLNDMVKAQLYSPADTNKAKLKILGDPDYLATNIGVTYQPGTKYFNKDRSININSGQVFIQLNFNTATDYGINDAGDQTGTGLLNVSDKVQFYESTSAKDAGIDGIVFNVIRVVSTLSKGVFLQTLECKVPPLEDLIGPGNAKSSLDASGRMNAESDPRVSAAASQSVPVNNASSATAANGPASGGNASEAKTAVDTRTTNTPPTTVTKKEDTTSDAKDAGSTANTSSSKQATSSPVNNTLQGSTVLDDTVTAKTPPQSEDTNQRA
jgi:hypothetical protein